jgi:cell division septum initiation protein DivIVA
VKGAAGEAGEAANHVLEAARDLARHSSEIKRELQGFLTEMQAA